MEIRFNYPSTCTTRGKTVINTVSNVVWYASPFGRQKVYFHKKTFDDSFSMAFIKTVNV